MLDLVKTVISGFILGQSLLWSDLIPLLSHGLDDHGKSSNQTSLIEALVTLYFSALITSTIIISVARATRRFKLVARSPSSYEWFKYDGNIIGGILQGIGMAMLRSEPGLLFVQLGMGVSRARWAALGGLVGGFAYVLLHPRLKRSNWFPMSTSDSAKKSSTIPMKQISNNAETVLLILAMVLSVGFVYLKSEETHVLTGLSKGPIYGGIMIGFSQLVSLVLTGGTLGVSSAYPTLANHVIRLFDRSRPNPGYNSLAFALGVIFSGSITSINQYNQGGQLDEGYNYKTSFLAGALLIFGARIAGGCTSGHGLSGCGLLSMSSYITILSMVFGLAICAAIA